MWTDIFRDKATMHIENHFIKVDFTHWLRRSSSFTIDLSKVKIIKVIQIEPCTIQIVFIMDDNKLLSISDEMDGWDSVLEFIQGFFIEFSREAIEHAKGKINAEYVCWEKAK